MRSWKKGMMTLSSKSWKSIVCSLIKSTNTVFLTTNNKTLSICLTLNAEKTEKVAHIKKLTYVSVLVSLAALVGGSELFWSFLNEGLTSGSLCSSSSENSVGSIIEVGVGRRSGLNLLSESNLKPQSSQLLTLCRGWCQVNACVCVRVITAKKGDNECLLT